MVVDKMILVTGGAGYIGSHTVKLLQAKGYPLVVYDNLSSGHRNAVKGVPFVVGDVLDAKLLEKTIKSYGVTDVIHFAASSIVGESMVKPDRYYLNNVVGTLTLLNTMLANSVKNIVFSSTAAVYGEPETVPITEDCPINPTNVYGQTKAIVEEMFEDYSRAYRLKYVSLRYFNACGADESGNIGEDHLPETHLIPLVLQTAMKKREKISIFGEDFPTKDGTCIRDYIHVSDLAEAHILALEYIRADEVSNVFNLGNGNGFSVKEVINVAMKATESPILTEVTARREGDPAVLVASAEKARDILRWNPEYTDLKRIIKTAWNWHVKNPEGYRDIRKSQPSSNVG